MMFIAGLLALLAVCEAFQTTVSSGARKGVSSLFMGAKSKSLPFLPQPTQLVGLPGSAEFDPFGFSNIIDVRFLQEAEIKHCRVAMLGVVGFIATQYFQLPGEIHQVTAVAAHDVHIKSGALIQLNFWVSLFEIISTKAVVEMLQGSGRQPGYFGFDPLKFSEGKSDAVKRKYQENEIQNGRLAMLAFGGIVTQAVLTGKEFPFF